MKRFISTFLTLLLFLSVFAPLSSSLTSYAEKKDESTSLSDIYKDDFLIGSVFSQRDITGERFKLIKKNFNVLTAENAMKPDAMQPTKGNFNFTQVDDMMKTIEKAGIMVHGHTLAWHQQSPPWLNTGVTREVAKQNLIDHVQGVAGHYAGKILSWDVLNEAMNDNPSNPDDWRSSLRQSNWYIAFNSGGNGEDYIDMLFREARKADPDAILYYNDYNLNGRNKAKAVYNMVKELNETYIAEGNTRLLIDGIGMQGHYSISTDVNSVEESIKLFSELGVEISITELDVTVQGVTNAGMSEQDHIRQGLVYAQLFNIFKKYSDNIARVTFWGLDDASSWRREQYPLLFNADLSPKLSYHAVADPDDFLETYGSAIQEGPREQQQQGTASFGTPTIDGTKDEIWQTTQELPINLMLQAWQTASGTAKVLWDENNLYILYEVTTDALDKTSLNPYERDSVEAFVDEDNCKLGSYKPDDGQYRVSYDNEQTYGDSTDSSGFESATSTEGTAYIVEMKIPFKTLKPKVDMVIGFDAQINDGNNGFRMGIAMWNDITGESWQNTTKWGELKLTDSEGLFDSSAVDSEPLQQTTQDTTNQDDIETPGTGIILLGVAIVGVIAYLIHYLYKRFGASKKKP